MLTMPEEINGDRIVLVRPYPATFDLAKEIFEKVTHSREVLRDWLPWVDSTKTAEDEYTNWLISWCQKRWQEGSGFAYLIRHKETQDLLGAIDLMRYIDKNKSAEIGYWLSNDATGKGYMIEAVKLLESVAFQQSVNRLVISNDTANERSINVAKRCGYHLDGVMRQEQWFERWHSFRDINVWSKLREEWLASQNKSL